jgi:hypothetical protein
MTLSTAQHNPGPLETDRIALTDRRATLRRLLADPFHRDTAAKLLRVHAELAALGHRLGEPDRMARADIAAGAVLGAAAGLGVLHADATVRMALGRRDAAIPPGGDAGMDAKLWCLAFSLACITGDRAARRWLGQDGVIRACQRGAAAAFWIPYCRALALIAQGLPAYGPLAEAASAAVSVLPEAAGVDEMEQVRRPLIALAALLREGIGGTDWTAGVSAALEAHRVFHAAAPGRARRGLAAFEILALCALARERGVVTGLQATDLPLAWLDGAWLPARLRIDFPEIAVADALEARWVIDLHGYSREGRSYRLETGAAGVLLVRYSVPETDDLPPAAFVFAQSKPAPGGPGLRALDVSQTVEAARRLASQGLVSEALAALRRALAVLPETDPARDSLVDLQAVWQVRAAAPGAPGPAPQPSVDMSDPADIATALVAAEALKRAARPMLEELRDENAAQRLAALRPRPEDYAKVFTADAVETTRDAFTRFWEASPPIRAPDTAYTELSLWVAPAGMLDGDNVLSRQFPGGYRGLARWLNPHRVWLAWRFAKPGAIGGLSYDGLVWCDDHWAWFPRPYLVLRDLVARIPNRSGARPG